MDISRLSKDSIALLQSLIKETSFSGEEGKTAELIQSYFERHEIKTDRIHNNIIARSASWDDSKPTVVLNSHHDTVKIGDGWSKDPFGAVIEEGKLYGRGSNDAGGALVALMAAFSVMHNEALPYNLMMIASGEEENFGPHGVASVLSELDVQPDFAIIGEPTEMHIAIAEKGLIVIDGEVKGESGHAARSTGVNALYLATEDINQIKTYQWDRISQHLGMTTTKVTQISAGSQHNVIPDICTYVIDCRVNEKYTLHEVIEVLDSITTADLKPRSIRWHPSGISEDHPIITSGKKLGRSLFGSPTLSDQVHFKCPSIKIGPGRSERSHTSDEYILLTEIEEGIEIYIALLRDLSL